MIAGHRQKVGRRGESLACAFLRRKGYRIICQNYRTRLGELDIVARQGRTLCFIEVKARATRAHGWPEEAVTPRKQRQISRAALWYLMRHNQTARTCRFDVVSIIDDGGPAPATIRLIQDAFPLPPPYAL